MSFTADEIKNIEIIVEGMEKVIEVISQQFGRFVYDRSAKTHRLREGETIRNICQDVYKASGLYLAISDPPSNLIRDILAKLYWDKPEIAKDLKERYYRHISDVSQLFKIKDANNLYNGLFNVQYELRELAQALQAGSKIAKAETKQPAGTEQDIAPNKWRKAWTCIRKIPNWIYVLVLFLAALFTIFHYLGVLLSQLGGPADSNVN